MGIDPRYGYFYKADMPDKLGNTQSGKPVLAVGQESYAQGFDEQDHLDAKKIHEEKAAQSEKRARGGMMTPGGKFNHRMIAQAQDQAAKHRDIAEWHEQQAPGEDSEAKDIKAAQRAQEQEGQENVQKSKKAKRAKTIKKMKVLEPLIKDLVAPAPTPALDDFTQGTSGPIVTGAS